MDEENKPEPKISLPEVIAIGFVLLVIDILEFFIPEDFGLGEVVTSPIFIYLYLKDVSATRQLITWVAELIPVLGKAPLLTIGWVLTVWIDRHPKSKLAKINEVSNMVGGKGAKGKLGSTGATGQGARQLARIQAQEEHMAKQLEEIKNADMSGFSIDGTRDRTATKQERIPTRVGMPSGDTTETTNKAYIGNEGRIPTRVGVSSAENERQQSDQAIDPALFGEEKDPLDKLKEELFPENLEPQNKKGKDETNNPTKAG